MRCLQCKNLAMYRVGEQDIPLCLDCYYKVVQIQQQQMENAERMINFAMEEMNMVTGIPLGTPRFPPRPHPVVLSGTQLHNIAVNNSVVGTINTGSIGTVDQSISALLQLGDPAVADGLKALSEAVLGSGDITPNQKNDLIESLSVIAREAATPKEQRQNSVALALIERAKKVTEVANDIASICEKWWPVLISAFTVAAGG